MTSETVNDPIFQEYIQQFKTLTKKYALFHICFLSFTFLQVIVALLFFSFFSQSIWAAIILATLCLTIFSYLVLYFYFQAKKPQQFIDLKENLQNGYIDTKNPIDSHLQSAQLFLQLSTALHELESTYYTQWDSWENISHLLKKFSIWMYWKDVIKMRELLLLSCINETIALVKILPLDIEAHVNLANAYITLSKLYIHPKKLDEGSSLIWVSPEYVSSFMQHKFQIASNRAVEELKVLTELCPNDLWTHQQLAKIYHAKGLLELEIQEYETLQEMAPEDAMIQYNLGTLYFQIGRSALGLKIYEKLIHQDTSLANQLIDQYDLFQMQDTSIESIAK